METGFAKTVIATDALGYGLTDIRRFEGKNIPSKMYYRLEDRQR